MPYVREERLSVKQIKQILKSKNIDYSNVVEKRDLILLVEENVPTLTEAKEILNKKKIVDVETEEFHFFECEHEESV